LNEGVSFLESKDQNTVLAIKINIIFLKPSAAAGGFFVLLNM
jgi:hypothetical protein